MVKLNEMGKGVRMCMGGWGVRAEVGKRRREEYGWRGEGRGKK